MDPFLQAVIGEYRVTGLIGEGGMGRVFRAVHTRLNRVVAIKILVAASGDGVFIQRFFNEAQIQSQLRNAGVAALYDFTEFRGSPVIIMEYVDGQTIQQITESRGAWTPAQALPVLLSCARTLSYVHSLGIVHRDLKSSNVKISSAGEVKLLDFGIATGSAAQRLTIAGFVIGTFQSLSPEQTRGEPATSASDIWAFGVLAYEMLTASLPFEGSNAAELFSKISRARFTAPTVLKPGLPQSIEKIIFRCLKRDPADRYSSMEELARDLARISPGETSGSSRGFRPAARTRQVLAFGSAILALCLLLAIGLHFTQQPAGPHDADGPACVGCSPALDNDHLSGSSTGGADPDKLRTVTIDTFDGSAEVWQNGVKLGDTPYDFRRPYGESVSAILKRPGFRDLPILFDVGERPTYEFTMDRSNSR